MRATHPAEDNLPFPALGISSYAYTWAVGVPGHPPAIPLTAGALLERAADLRMDRLQLADNLPVHTLPSTEWRDLMDRATEAGIMLELGLRGLTETHLSTYIRLAEQCASPFLRVVIDAAGYEPDHGRIVAVIRAVLPALRGAGVRLAIENHDRFRASELVDIIEATDPEWVGICLDTANSLGADEGIYEVTRLLGPYTINLHVKDYRIERFDHQMGFTVTGRAAGEGQTPVEWLFGELSRHPRWESATLETWLTPLETLPATIARESEWSQRGAAYLQHTRQQLANHEKLPRTRRRRRQDGSPLYG